MRYGPPMSETTQTRTGTVHQLKVTLKGAKPPIWRRLLVPSSITLMQLHEIIQEAMGWYNCHLHEFEIDGICFGPDDLDGWDPQPKNEATAELARLAPAGSRFTYLYDFGDSWEHVIDVEKVVAREPGQTYPACLTGRRACPPEDCGGVWGYAELLQVVADPTHEDHEEMADLLDDDFNPATFDLQAVNRRLRCLA